jgi:hypothetical protein
MFDLSELLRTDPKTQAEIHALRLANRVFNPNECREELGRNPYDGGDEYINPAISQAGSTERAEPDSGAANAAVESQLRHMIRVESKRVLQHADDKNFLSWMESWYADWEKTLADKLEELGVDRDLATNHCEESKKQLLEATDSKPEEFKKTLENCVKTWENRAILMKKGDSSQLSSDYDESQVTHSVLELAKSIANQKQPEINVTVAASPAPNVNVTTPEVVVNIPKQDAPIINVAASPPAIRVVTPRQDAPIVTVTNEVQPAAVDVNVNLPPRLTRTSVQRDRDGRIIGSEQVEEDL